MAFQQRQIFSLDDSDEGEDVTEFAIEAPALGDLDDLPPELREALMEKPKLLQRSPLFEQSPTPATPPPPSQEVAANGPAVLTPVSSGTEREVEYEVKSSAAPPEPVKRASQPKLVRTPSGRKERHGGQHAGAWNGLVSKVSGSFSLWGQDEEDEEETDETEGEYESEEEEEGEEEVAFLNEEATVQEKPATMSWLGGVFGGDSSQAVASEESEETTEESADDGVTTSAAAKRPNWGRCSWCLEEGDHVPVRAAGLLGRLWQSRGRVAPPQSRCMSCTALTEPCGEGCGRRARAGSGKCAWCVDHELMESVESIESRWVLTGTGVERMGEASSLREQAARIGHLRSFVLLAGMRPGLRRRLGAALGVALVGSKSFGDAHRESWLLLSAPGGGLAQQSPQQTGWSGVLRVLLEKCFEGQAAPPSSDDDVSAADLEKLLLGALARFCLATGRFRAVDFSRVDKEGLHLKLGHQLGAESGGDLDRAVLNYAWRIVAAARGQADEDEAATPAAPRKPFPVPGEVAALFNAVVMLLNQRILLAAEGVSPEQMMQ